MSTTSALPSTTANEPAASTTKNNKRRTKKIRYAVVGLGHIAQNAVLPAFPGVKRNSQLVALFSDDAHKRDVVGKQYGVDRVYAYEDFDDCLSRGDIDAVYVALPNHLHRDFTVRAARHGVHVLCEKPMAVTEDDCEVMIRACEEYHVKLMIAYRLHFEQANLEAIEVVNSGQIGQPRVFDSMFSMQVQAGNVRTHRKEGGGTLYDIGVYCINAARGLFKSEPIEVSAFSARGSDPRFADIDEMTSAILRFPDDRLATFTTSFGAADMSSYRVLGTEGDLRLEPAYDYQKRLRRYLTVKGVTEQRTYSQRDHFAPELLYFSDCILEDRHPEPCGREGLADVRIVRALYRSAAEGRPVKLEPFSKHQRPSAEQEIECNPNSPPELVDVHAPTSD